ncbi:MAG: hypothetical protein PHO15_06660 [Eubacteriales bacterium]|nr:hypothetical protein [Eubacteriales bacterium]
MLDWIQNRWFAVIIFILAVIAVSIFIILICAPHQGTYTNAWYV